MKEREQNDAYCHDPQCHTRPELPWHYTVELLSFLSRTVSKGEDTELKASLAAKVKCFRMARVEWMLRSKSTIRVL